MLRISPTNLLKNLLACTNMAENNEFGDVGDETVNLSKFNLEILAK